jgi:hypothetical protein
MRFEAFRFASFAIGVTLIIGLVRGGAGYLYCPFMDEVVSAHCCAPAHADTTSFEAPDCCEARILGTLPAARDAARPHVAAAAPVHSVIRALERASTRQGPSPAPRLARRGLGPAPPDQRARAARSMVSLS